jgi:hypothetical protein
MGDELRDWWAMDEPGLATDAWIAVRGDEIVGSRGARRHEEAFAGHWEVTPSPLDKSFRRRPLRLGARPCGQADLAPGGGRGSCCSSYATYEKVIA